MIPTDCADPINRRILCVAEDRVTGFHVRPFDEIARLTGLDVPTVTERLRAMLAAGTIRRVRQTLLSTSLAEGALIAWKVPEDKLESAYAWLRDNDPFTGHVVLRSSENPAAPGADYRLWTTLKVPTGYGSMQEHCAILSRIIGLEDEIAESLQSLFSVEEK